MLFRSLGGIHLSIHLNALYPAGGDTLKSSLVCFGCHSGTMMDCAADSCATDTISSDCISELAQEYAAYTTIPIAKQVIQEIATA